MVVTLAKETPDEGAPSDSDWVRTPDALLAEFGRHRGKRRLLILDPALMGESGHHFGHDRALIGATRRANIPSLVLGFTDCSKDVRQSLPVVPHFAIQPYFKPSVHSTAEEDFATLNDAFLHCLANMPVTVTDQDVVLFPTVTQNQLLAIAAWMVSRLTKGGCPHVVIGLMFGPEWVSSNQRDSAQPDLYRRAFASWPPVVRERVKLVCETVGHARIYGELSGLPVRVLPAPTVSQYHRVPRQPAPSSIEPFIVGYLGHARMEKGVHLLAETANIAHGKTPQIQFRVQLNYPNEYPLVRDARIRLTESDAVLPLTMGPLDEEAYARFIDSCHLILLPYDPERYRSRGSGLIREALYRGRPVVVPKYTEMGAWVERERVGFAFEHYSAPSIASAVSAARVVYSNLSERASLMSVGLEPEQQADQYVDYLMATGTL